MVAIATHKRTNIDRAVKSI
jgi:calcium-dependent protein kinase